MCVCVCVFVCVCLRVCVCSRVCVFLSVCVPQVGDHGSMSALESDMGLICVHVFRGGGGDMEAAEKRETATTNKDIC